MTFAIQTDSSSSAFVLAGTATLVGEGRGPSTRLLLFIVWGGGSGGAEISCITVVVGPYMLQTIGRSTLTDIFWPKRLAKRCHASKGEQPRGEISYITPESGELFRAVFETRA